MRPALSGTITAVEVTEGGDGLSVRDRGVTDVDVNSTVHLTMNHAAIAQAIELLAGVDPAQGNALRTRLARMAEVVAARNAALAHLTNLADKDASGQTVTHAELGHLGRLETRVVDAAKIYAREAGIHVSAMFSAARYTGLNEERNALLAEHQAYMSELSRYAWRVEATLTAGGKSTPIHLPNYDTLREGDLSVISKLSPAMTDDVRKQLATARGLSRELNEVIQKRDRLSDFLVREFRKVVAAKLDAVYDQFKALLLDERGRLRAMVTALAALPATIANTPEAKRLIRELDGVHTTLVEVDGACKEPIAFVKKVLGGSQAALSRSDVQSTMDCVGSLAEAIAKLEERLGATASAAAALIPLAKKKGMAALKKHVPKLNLLVKLQSQFAGAQDGWTLALGVLFGANRQLSTPVFRDGEFTDRSVRDVVDTSIELPRTPRKEGDVVHFRAYIVADGKPVVTGATTQLRVVRAGLAMDVSAAVNFVHPFELSDGEKAFSAVPALAVTIHYRNWRESGSTAGNGWWNAIDPGIGLHFAYPDLGATKVDANDMVIESDPSFELGVGGVIQLFGDVLQAGVGYDLQAERSYWYLGFGLHRLTKLGVTLPLGGS